MTTIKRHILQRLLDALEDSPVVYLNGPRQAGKSTLVQRLPEFEGEYITFDNATQMAAAANAPTAFLSNRDKPLIIDEVQLVPDMFRSLKEIVDQLRLETDGPVRGRFLLTGSANVMALPALADSLVGRMGVLTLFPLSGAEATGGNGDFLTRLFETRFASNSGTIALSEVISRATFPEISGAKARTRSNWFESYITTILQRDVKALADIEKLASIPNLLRILASRACGLINDADIARDAGLLHVTSRNYRSLLKHLFLTFELEPWFRNVGKRLVKARKGYISDTLLLCHLLQYDLDDLDKANPSLFGHILENFVATELTKLIANTQMRCHLRHFRTADNKEVDFVLELPNGQLAGIEVKNSDRVGIEDFKGLKTLQALSGPDFVCGIVLYRGKDVVPFGTQLWAVPVSGLWA